MNTLYLSYKENDEIASIMSKKFASKLELKQDNNNNTIYLPMPLDSLNKVENKINDAIYLFPSLPKEKIENIFNNKEKSINDKEMNIDEGIQQLKELTLSENNHKNNINKNNFSGNINATSSIFDKYNVYKKRTKRNYNQLLNQTYNNININNNINNIQDNNKEIERKKLELKNIDTMAEESLNSKDEKDLKEYLFIQLYLLEIKKEKNRKILEIQNKINHLDYDYNDLNKCCNTIIKPINKRTKILNNINNEINDLKIEIDKAHGRIKYYEYYGNIYKNFQKNNDNNND